MEEGSTYIVENGVDPGVKAGDELTPLYLSYGTNEASKSKCFSTKLPTVIVKLQTAGLQSHTLQPEMTEREPMSQLLLDKDAHPDSGDVTRLYNIRMETGRKVS